MKKTTTAQAQARTVLLAVTLVLPSCGGGSTAPPAATPVLETVLKPGASLTTIGVDSAGEFEVLPAPSVILWVRIPAGTTLEVAVDGVVLEETSSVARQQTLSSQGLGFWFHRSGSPNVTLGGDPRWDIAVSAAPRLRVSQRFTIGLTNVSGNSATPRSAPLSVRVAIGIPDWVSLPGNINDDAVVLLDGQRPSGCVDDEVWRGRHLIDVGDMRARGGCNEEMIVFSTDDAVQMVDRTITGIWTDSLRDFTPTQASAGPLQVPVDVWLLASGLMTRARADVTRANAIFGPSRCGLQFVPTFRDMSGTPAAAALFGTNIITMESATWRTALTTSAFFTAGRINAYYIGSPFTGRAVSGFNAGSFNRNIIGIDTTADAETLSHEFGHSFTLDHTNGLTGFSATNLMLGGTSGRNMLTEGQCFRVNVNRGSSVNLNLVRTGWLRDCPDNTTNAMCPALAFDRQ